MTVFARRIGVLFVVLLVVDTVAVTILAMVRPEEWGIAPIIFPIVLGFIGLVVFSWAPRWRLSSEQENGMPPVARMLFRISLAVIAASQVFALIIALGCLAVIIFLIAAG